MNELEQRERAAEVMAGRASADELPGMKALRDRDAARAEQLARAGHKAPVFRDCRDGVSRAVPEAVLASERADGIERVFVQTRDRLGDPWQGWIRPTEKPASVEAEEKVSGIPYRLDPISGRWISEPVAQMPAWMRRVNDALPEGDVRRPWYDQNEGRWRMPKLGRPDQEPGARDDGLTRSPNGYPLLGDSELAS
jgi:hypothetical protein